MASPNLTAQPYDEWTLLGRTVKVETAAEIVAKKLRHRDAFLTQILQRRAVLSAQFEAIDALGDRPPYDEAVDRARRFLLQLPAV